MTHPTYVLLYVDNPSTSAKFYSELLNLQPVEAAPTFVLYVLPTGIKLGLWGRHTVEPAVHAASVSGELCFTVEDKPAVQAMYQAWGKRGLRIAQEPKDMDFGHTFVALDPDGHRLRVFAPGAR